ncbi:MAG TPA: sigma 54-interacting transcriptional regulator [Polyangiales bacterium]|nr:sigma 54-interacting transcriptional regulator [Polyangiales bacterium]
MSGALTAVLNEEGVPGRRIRLSRLLVIDGPDRGKELSIERERATVGRSLICDLVLADKAVSGTHFEIQALENGFILRDLESTNGTWCGDVQVREVWIKHGQTIRAGTTVLRFEPLDAMVAIDTSARDSFHELVGRSVRMREIFALLERVGPTDLTVLIRGETGTGKELVARALHRASKRASHSLVVQDCSAIARELVESTLFGHEKGSFTGAIDRKLGCFETAERGTIFLDEVGELDLGLQPKLLRVLETRTIKRVGGTKEIPIDVRVVAATNRDLRKMVGQGSFREDLYYRLGVVTVELPSLRERPEDIPLLVQSFLEALALRRFPGEDKRFEVADDAMARLCAYAWPGNVRELRNTVERGASLAEGLRLEIPDLLPSSTRLGSELAANGSASQFVEEGLPFKEAKQRVLDQFEASYLRSLLDKHGGNVTRSAQAAGLTRYHLRELAKRFGIRGTVD